MEETNKQYFPLYIAFIDFKKDIDCMGQWAIKMLLKNKWIDYRYIEMFIKMQAPSKH